MKKSMISFVAVVFAALIAVDVDVHAAPGSADSAQQASQPSQSPGQEDSAISGKVIETMTSGGYTYALVEKNGQQTWVAVPATKILVGQQLSFRPGVAMGSFESKTLKRKFDNIIFSPGLLGQAPMAHGTEMSSDRHTAGNAPAEKPKIEKAQGENAYTINELINNRAKLDKKAVAVKGEVIKVSEKIMGKNWVHIVDNTTKDDLVVTSQDLPKIGDIVTVQGTFYKDKDFGSGYKFKMIIEDANIR